MKNEIKHTLGPWTFAHQFNAISIQATKPTQLGDLPEICELSKQSEVISVVEQTANARLIAAAPEMAVGLQEAINEIGYLVQASYDAGFSGTKRSLELIERLQALLAKAGRDV